MCINSCAWCYTLQDGCQESTAPFDPSLAHENIQDESDIWRLHWLFGSSWAVWNWYELSLRPQPNLRISDGLNGVGSGSNRSLSSRSLWHKKWHHEVWGSWSLQSWGHTGVTQLIFDVKSNCREQLKDMIKLGTQDWQWLVTTTFLLPSSYRWLVSGSNLRSIHYWMILLIDIECVTV